MTTFTALSYSAKKEKKKKDHIYGSNPLLNYRIICLLNYRIICPSKKNYRIIFFKKKKITLLNKLKSITSAQCTSYAFKVSNFCWIQILENFCESFDLFFFPFFLLKLVILDLTEKEINITMRC